MRKMLLAVVAVTAVAMPACAGETWWQQGYPAGCVTDMPDYPKTPADAFEQLRGKEWPQGQVAFPVLRDHGDYVDIVDLNFAGTGEEHIVYRYFRSKDLCVQRAAEAEKWLHEFLGQVKKQDLEEHPNLDQYH